MRERLELYANELCPFTYKIDKGGNSFTKHFEHTLDLDFFAALQPNPTPKKA